jgi:hypothetical protein
MNSDPFYYLRQREESDSKVNNIIATAEEQIITQFKSYQKEPAYKNGGTL